jgi:PD-(D/E)XK nuclease superfamily
MGTARWRTAFLMDPRGNHGLGDAFVKRMLQRALMVAGDVPVPVTPIELELWDLSRTEVRKEWHHIDILLVDEDHHLVVIVENKIGTKEHSDQRPRPPGRRCRARAVARRSRRQPAAGQAFRSFPRWSA